MATQFFRRHTRKCLDAAVRRALDSLAPRPAVRGAFARLLTVVHARSDLLRAPPDRDGAFPHLDALVNLARFHRDVLAGAYDWHACGHPLLVIHSLAGHLLGRYPTPRFLGSVWFGGNSAAERLRRGWFVQHARGRRFRTLSLPLAMTRRMEHAFLHSPDHLDVNRALRRAEVLGLGGSPQLANAVIATRLGRSFEHGAAWREAIAWLVRWSDDLDLAQVGPIIDYLQAMRHEPTRVRTPGGPTFRGPLQPDLSLRGRSLDSLWRDVTARLEMIGKPGDRPKLSWRKSRWNELVVGGRVASGRARMQWRLVELLDSNQLRHEGISMRHCVATYAQRCAGGASTIWSLRRHRIDEYGTDDHGWPALTIEVSPRTATIVNLRGRCNRRASGEPLAVVRAWAARERLAFAVGVERQLDPGG